MPNKHFFRKIGHAETLPDKQKYHKKKEINNNTDDNIITKYVFVLSILNTKIHKNQLV